MASTYSNLKIQLMATGENATTWGDVTNINLGTALEEAIVGSADVTFASGNVTLTLTDSNLTQTARNMRLRCTGTTGGSTRNLVVPSIEKPYLVKNDCADSVVVKTAAGSGITVPAGKSMWLYVDGTNVVDATSHLTSLTLGTALAIADGGTGANTASGARTALGLGSLATASSVNLATQVTGTLPLGNGGTGVTGTPSNGQLLIGNGTGFSLATLTAGSNVTITNGVGGITISAAGGGGGGGTVTSVSGSGGSTGLTLTGGPITTSGTLTLGGTLAVASGGTGATSASSARTNLGLGSGDSVSFASVSTSGNITASGNVTAYSDANLKKDLVRIEGALDKIEALTGYVYTRIDTGARQTGLIAQDVQKVLPEAVEYGEYYLSVAYGNMMGLMVEAIKELRAELADLRAQTVKVI